MNTGPLLLVWKLLLCGFILLLSGCTGGNPFQDAAAIVAVRAESIERDIPAPGSLERVDWEIANLKKNKKKYQEDANVQRELAVDSGDYQDHHLKKAADLEKEIVRIEREMAKMETKKQKLLSESMGCFPPETLVVLENGSTKSFAEILVGDRVMTYDIGHELSIGKSVINLYSLEANHLYSINDDFKTTGGERLLTQEGWKTVRNLKIGDTVHANGRMVTINKIQVERVDSRVVNMEVADTHNFYIQTQEGSTYLVHNSSGGGSDGGGGGK